MIARFVEKFGDIYRVLSEDSQGAWLISYDSPSSPFFVTSDDITSYVRCEAPSEYLAATSLGKELTAAQCSRLQLIQPLLDNPESVCSKAERHAVAKSVADTHGTSIRRVLNIYYRFLATGHLTRPKKRGLIRHEVYESAIKDYYFTSKKMSLRETYEMMLLRSYTSATGQLVDGAPTWASFRHYYYSHGFSKDPQKVIAREGLSKFKRDYRPKFGSAAKWRDRPGCFQMDATQADIFLVSQLDKKTVVGRPYVYLAVDTTTQLIAGIYVGFEAGESAVMECLSQAATDKVKYCEGYGIPIDHEQWPNSGAPYEIVSDQGREFTGGRLDEFSRRYGVELHALPPFRPDEKGIVEKAFDMIQARYKPLLRGKGVIEPDSQERWSVDYQKQAVLTLKEFTAVIIHAVLYLNSGRVLKSGKTAAQAWMEATPDLLSVPSDDIHMMGLPRKNVKLTRKGFYLQKVWYTPQSMDGLSVGMTYTLAYDPNILAQVFIVEEKQYRPCKISSEFGLHTSLSSLESGILLQQLNTNRRDAEKKQLEASLKATREIQRIIDESRGKGV